MDTPWTFTYCRYPIWTSLKGDTLKKQTYHFGYVKFQGCNTINRLCALCQLASGSLFNKTICWTCWTKLLQPKFTRRSSETSRMDTTLLMLRKNDRHRSRLLMFIAVSQRGSMHYKYWRQNCTIKGMKTVSGQIMIFHQPRFPWNKRIFLPKRYLLGWGRVRSL